MNSRQKVFCEGYITSGNAYKSALAAGYSESSARKNMARVLNKPEVARYIEKRQAALAEKLVDTRKVVQELESIAFFDIDEVAVVEDGVLMVRDTKPLGKKKRAPIALLRQGTHGVEMKPYDKMRALALLGQMAGMFREQKAQAEPAQGSQPFQVEVVVVEADGGKG